MNNNDMTEFKSRRVSLENISVNLKTLLTDSECNICDEVEFNGITQGYNLTGVGVIIKLPESLQCKTDLMTEKLIGTSVNIIFNFESEGDNTYDAIGIILRADKPKTAGYDIFCAIEFEYLSSQTALIISRKLKEEEKLLKESGISRSNFFELKKEA